jgi:hypothetical protein
MQNKIFICGVYFKLNVASYAKEHGNRVAERCFIPAPLIVKQNNKVKVKLSLCLTKYHTMKTYSVFNQEAWGVEV